MPNLPTEKLIYKMGKLLLQDHVDLDNKLQHVVSIIASHFKVEKCSIMLINQEDLTLEVKAATNPAIIGFKRKLSDVTISTRALIDNAPFYADGKRLSYFIPPDATRYASEFSLSLPIKYLDKKIGVLNLADSKSGRQINQKQQDAALEITQHLAIYLYATQTKNQLEDKVKKFEDTIAQLVRLDELKTSLTNFIVHDLKGPISTIMANLDMLSYENLTKQQFDYLNLSLDDVYKMQRMVMNILDVLKLEEGRIKIYREEADIYNVAEKEVSTFRNMLSLRNLEIVLDGTSRVCYIDESLIGRTIANLLMNAIEHSSDGKRITVRIQYDPVKKESAVSVSDQGAGVPDEFKEKIFDKFFQIEETRRQRKATTGLGLTFCKLVVNAHGGDIRIEDSEDGGARFIFTLPEILADKLKEVVY